MNVATAPISWGIFYGNEPVEPKRFLDEVVEAGYAGTELGPPGYLGEGDELRNALTFRQLRLVGAFLPLPFTDPSRAAANATAALGSLERLEASAPFGELPTVLLSDAYEDPARIASAGRVEDHPEVWLSDSSWSTLRDQIDRIATLCRERGFDVAFHPHAGSHVETPRETERLFAGLDPDLIGLCLDTGHTFFGGGNPLELLESHGLAPAIVHIKDVDLDVLAQLKSEGFGLDEAWRRGVFCPLGSGGVDLDAVLGELNATAYGGWLVVEQDRVLEGEAALAAARQDAVKNRGFLSARGI